MTLPLAQHVLALHDCHLLRPTSKPTSLLRIHLYSTQRHIAPLKADSTHSLCHSFSWHFQKEYKAASTFRTLNETQTLQLLFASQASNTVVLRKYLWLCD